VARGAALGAGPWRRTYDAKDVVSPARHHLRWSTRSRGLTADKLWGYLSERPFVKTHWVPSREIRAMQQVKAGLGGHLPVRLAGGR